MQPRVRRSRQMPTNESHTDSRNLEGTHRPTFREELQRARLRQENRYKEEMVTQHRMEEEPSMQQRRRNPKKKPKGLQKGRIFRLLAVLAMILGLVAFLHQPWVAFGRLQVEGTALLTQEEVEQMADAPKPMNLFRLNWHNLLQKVRSDYRVEKATLGYGWPLTLKLYVNDRQPVLYVNFTGKTYGKLDATGHVIGVGQGIADGSAPVLTGYSIGKDLSLGELTDDQEVLGILGFLGKLSAPLRDRITGIAMDTNKNLKFYLSGGVPLIVGTYENANNKLDTIAAICRELETKKIKAEYIDVTYEKPYVKVLGK